MSQSVSQSVSDRGREGEREGGRERERERGREGETRERELLRIPSLPTHYTIDALPHTQLTATPIYVLR